jgi:hypothetical protein
VFTLVVRVGGTVVCGGLLSPLEIESVVALLERRHLDDLLQWSGKIRKKSLRVIVSDLASLDVVVVGDMCSVFDVKHGLVDDFCL